MYRLRASFLKQARCSTTGARGIARCRQVPAVSAVSFPTSFRSYSAREKGPAPLDYANKTTGGITVGRKSKSGKTGYCYGCGADLVKGEAGSMGTVLKSGSFWAHRADEVKKSKIKNWALCPRCKKLRKLEEQGGVTPQAVSLGPDSKMTDVFRQEVSKIRTKEKAVVVLCVDSINVNGTLLSTIRKYVGGNPILLAVTRCDLLPDYVWENRDPDTLKQIFRDRAKSIMPADVYLCSEAKGVMQQIGGIKELALDLWEHLNGRDPYIIGCANIGKSTLTDILISGFINKGEQLRHFSDKLANKRLEKLKETRITKSALPGTTLQNVRVPCFEDHNQALWDTPGLLVDTSLKQFPIRNYRTIRAQRPKQIKPHIYIEEERKSLALLVSEKDDKYPILRFEIRLKKNAEGEGPVRLVWNSTMDFDTRILDINEAREEENARWPEIKKRIDEEKAGQMEREKKNQEELGSIEHLSAEEKVQRKEERRQAYLERQRQEKIEMGVAEWHKRETEKKAATEEDRRSRILVQLTEVHQVVVEKGTGVDLAVANMGWLGVLMPRTAMIKTFAPNTGVRVSNYDTLALPPDWGEYGTTDADKVAAADDSGKVVGGGDDDDDMDYGDADDTALEDYGEYADFMGEYDGFDGEFDDDLGVPDDEPDDFGFDRHHDEPDDDDFDDEDMGDYSGRGRGGRGRGGGRGGGGGGNENYGESFRDRFYREREEQGQKATHSYQAYRNKEAPVGAPDHWAEFAGKHVGWQYDSDTRWMTGPRRLEEGWNPLRETSQKDKEEKERAQKRKAKKKQFQ